jgi:hypothetical protein
MRRRNTPRQWIEEWRKNYPHIASFWRNHPMTAPETPVYELIRDSKITGLIIDYEKQKVMLPSVAVAAYAIGEHKEMTPGAIRNWRYTEDQGQAMDAVERGLWVKFVKMYRLPSGQLVVNPWVNIAAAYTPPEEGNPQLETYAAGVEAYAAGVAAHEEAESTYHGRPWTENDVRKLRDFHYTWKRSGTAYSPEKGISTIARLMGRSPVAIAYKLHALGLEPNP